MSRRVPDRAPGWRPAQPTHHHANTCNDMLFHATLLSSVSTSRSTPTATSRCPSFITCGLNRASSSSSTSCVALSGCSAGADGAGQHLSRGVEVLRNRAGNSREFALHRRVTRDDGLPRLPAEVADLGKAEFCCASEGFGGHRWLPRVRFGVLNLRPVRFCGTPLPPRRDHGADDDEDHQNQHRSNEVSDHVGTRLFWRCVVAAFRWAVGGAVVWSGAVTDTPRRADRRGERADAHQQAGRAPATR